MSILSQFLRSGGGGSPGSTEDLMVFAVIAGGGGGGGNADGVGRKCGGGGGAGMVIQTFVPISYNTRYTITVGGGGNVGSVGNFSSFGSLTAFGGGSGGRGLDATLDVYTHVGLPGANGGGGGASNSIGTTQLKYGVDYTYSNQVNPWGLPVAYSRFSDGVLDPADAAASANDVDRGRAAGGVYSTNVLFPTIIGAGNGGGRSLSNNSGGSNGGAGGGGAGTYPVEGTGGSATSASGGADGGRGAWLRFFDRNPDYNGTTTITPAVSGYDTNPYQIGGGGAGGSRTGTQSIGGLGGANGGFDAGGTGGNPSNAPANRAGGGGGGTSDDAVNTGSNGGSGVVMIAYPISFNAAVTTGSPVLDTTIKTGYRVYRYNSSGTFLLPG